MTSTLILHHQGADSKNTVTWLYYAADKQPITEYQLQHSSLDELAHLNTKTEIIMVIPAADVSLRSLKLPNINRKKMLQAIPYMLEENLAEDIDQLHFSFTRDKINNAVIVAIIKKTLMTQWLTQLRNHQLRAAVCIPESLLLPLHDDGWTIFLEDRLAIIRLSRYQGTSIEHRLLPFLINQYLHDYNKRDDDNENQVGEEDITQPVLHIYLGSATQHQDLLTQIKGNMQLHIHDKPLLLTFASIIQENEYPLNLLQNEFRAREKTNKLPWITLFCLMIGTTSLMLTAKIVENFILDDHLTHLNNQVTSVFQQIFPEATSVSVPKIRIQEKINALKQVQKDAPFIELLSIVGESLQKTPGLQLQSIVFNNKQLTMQVVTSSAANIDRLIETLHQYGVEIKENNINAEHNAVSSKLSIVLGKN